ncbi:MAG: hypothetical protein EOM05_06520 [Clostridia bacterium]|nr:hypothetical protein [Clostridia bacterium]
MQQGQMKYFLGTNSSIGFFSLFDELYDPFENSKAYIIKGGPGTGKSGVMKKVAKKAQQEGIECELIYCSSDPESLDAVIFPQIKVCIADGTAPHIVEPRFPGCVEQIVNLGECWDADKLRKNADEIKALTVENSGYHQRAQRFLSASSALLSDSRKIVSQYTDYEKLINYSVRLARRELGCAAVGKKAKRRMLSAVTPNGLMTFESTIKDMCERIVLIDDCIGDTSEHILKLVAEYAQGCGYSVIVCPSPTFVTGIDQVLVPELSLAFVREQTVEDILPIKKIHARRFMDSVGIKNHKYRMKFNKKAGNDLQNEAIKLLKSAKQTHDKLESYYIEAMNFDAVDDKADKLIRDIGF